MLDKKLESLEQRFHELEKYLSSPDILSQPDDYKHYSKEHASLYPIIQKYREYKKIIQNLNSLEDLLNSDDEELKSMALIENKDFNIRKNDIESEIKILLLPQDPNDDKNIIVEIRAGTGGDEAALFAGDLFRMYSRYAENKGWKTELINSHATGLGGFKEVVFNISGEKVWRNFKFERGIHRVQRVPLTEASGRIHTSAVTVAVLPEVEDIDVEIKIDELRIDTYRSSGAGGQHVNKTESAIRITHIPTGIVVACQDERSQMKNRAKAMRLLRARLYEQKQIDQQQSITSDRKQQVGSGDRSEKIRTYNFPQNRITDHRIEFSLYRLKEVLEGDMDELVQKLVHDEQEKKLAGIENL